MFECSTKRIISLLFEKINSDTLLYLEKDDWITTFALFRCDNPFQPHVPASLIGKWKLVRNDAMTRDGAYDHDSPVGKKCPQFWEIGDKSVVENTTMMGVLCRDGMTCDTRLKGTVADG
jgi:hypothetical protein